MAEYKSNWRDMDLSIGNIDALLGNENDEKIHPLIPSQKNLRMCVVGGSGTGKTSFLVQFITKFMRVEKLYVCAKHLDQPKLKWLHDFYTEIETKINEKLRKKKKTSNASFKIIEAWTNDLNDFPNVDELDKTKKNVIVYDDLVLERDPTNKIGNAFVRGRHHGASVFYLSQTFFGIPRKIRLNTNYYAIFNLPSLTEITRIHREIAGDLDKKEFIELIRRALAEEYYFFFVATDEKKKFLKYRVGLDGLLISPSESKSDKK
jgi:hypothetical protein